MLIGKPKEDEANRIIRERIADTRIRQGMTQVELAEDIQKSQKNLSDIERGRTEVSAADLMYIAAQLQKPVRYFLPVNVPEPDILEEEWDMLRDYRRMWKKENRLLARQLLKEIADRETERDLAMQREENKIAREELKKVNRKNADEVKAANLRALARIEQLHRKRKRHENRK